MVVSQFLLYSPKTDKPIYFAQNMAMTIVFLLCLALSNYGQSLSFSTHDASLDRVLNDYMTSVRRQYDQEQDFLPQESPLASGHFQDVLLDGSPSQSFVDQSPVFRTRLDDLFSSDALDSDTGKNAEPTSAVNLRDQEFLEHSSLIGHQYVQGGAGEGVQRLKPDGSIANIQVVKTDAVLPSYCNPPNPCPVGYSAQDGCLEEFENTAAFSREYQSTQECMCDTEHMFDCPGATEDNELDTLARSLSNNGLTEDAVDRLADTLSGKQDDGIDHKVVAKKFFTKKEKKEKVKVGHFAAREKKGSKGTSERAILPFMN